MCGLCCSVTCAHSQVTARVCRGVSKVSLVVSVLNNFLLLVCSQGFHREEATYINKLTITKNYLRVSLR